MVHATASSKWTSSTSSAYWIFGLYGDLGVNGDGTVLVPECEEEDGDGMAFASNAPAPAAETSGAATGTILNAKRLPSSLLGRIKKWWLSSSDPRGGLPSIIDSLLSK